MKKELPKMYCNKDVNGVNNVQNVYSSLNEKKLTIENKEFSKVSIEEKIKNIFNSSSFVYKADVNIVTDKGISKKRIIAKKDNFLITMDNEIINIRDIKDIYI